MMYSSLMLVAHITDIHWWRNIEHYLIACLGLLCVAAIVYYSYALYAAIRFFATTPKVNTSFHPPVSILKPICGVDSSTYENLASFCQQDYPDYQIIFGVQTLNDPSLKVVKQIIQDFPAVDIQFVISDRPLGTNRKVGNLVNALTRATHGILILADSDVRVQRNYLQNVIQPLIDPKVGVVTCLYRSFTQGWIATLEALSTSTEFHPGVLVSNQMEGTKFAMGQTIVIRRSVLEKIGGFEGIVDYLADDFQLGYRPTQIGYKVILSQHVINHMIPVSTVMDSFRRQIRWMMGIRVSHPGGYIGLIFTYGTVSSLLLLFATSGSIWSWIMLIITWTIRLLLAWLVGVRYLSDPVANRFLWLVPLRDCMSFGLWCCGFFCNTIQWRDRQFKLIKSGELIELAPLHLADQVPSTISS